MHSLLFYILHHPMNHNRIAFLLAAQSFQLTAFFVTAFLLNAFFAQRFFLKAFHSKFSLFTAFFASSFHAHSYYLTNPIATPPSTFSTLPVDLLSKPPTNAKQALAISTGKIISF